MSKPSLLVVYASATGRTRRMAEVLGEGADSAGVDAKVCRTLDADPEAVLDADGLVLGSGVHMAGIESEMRAFLEQTAPFWMQGSLRGKLGGAFASAGAGGRGGGELALISLWAGLAEHGIVMVPMHNRLEGFAAAGCHWGPLAWTNPRAGEPGPTEQHLAACRAHGVWLAECLLRWGGAEAGPG